MSVRGLPSSTEIRKPVHKKMLYAKFPTVINYFIDNRNNFKLLF